jgi:hypothetical protein
MSIQRTTFKGALEFAKNGCLSMVSTRTWEIVQMDGVWIESTTTKGIPKKTAAGFRCGINQKTVETARSLILLHQFHMKKKSKFSKLATQLKKEGADDPKALAAWIGRKKLGAAEFMRRAAAGRKKAAKG